MSTTTIPVRADIAWVCALALGLGYSAKPDEACVRELFAGALGSIITLRQARESLDELPVVVDRQNLGRLEGARHRSRNHPVASEGSTLTMLTSTAPARPSADVQRCDIRPLQPGDGLEIRRIFRATTGLRRPHAIEYADLISYERLCLDWYLTVGRADARVIERDGQIVGYLIVCLNQPAYDAWARRGARRWAGRAAYRLATGQLGANARRFTALHIRDVRVARRRGTQRSFPAHAHLNVAADLRDAGIGHWMVATIDELVESAGLCGWYGEIDVPADGSLGAFERDGVRIVRRVLHQTYSWIHGTPVHRVTVARNLSDRPPSHRPPRSVPTITGHPASVRTS